MIDFIQTVLLIVIAWFIITGKSGDGFKKMHMFDRKRRIVLDSCSLIDGRIVEIVTSGFAVGELVIPQFILNELQMLADGNDSHKRERARFGLDIAHQLQDASPLPVEIDRTVFEGISATDDKLVALSKKLRAQLYTTDYNLAKVAAIEGVQVLNVNELAQKLRPISLPGETLTIKIVQKGSNHGQGVGYLDDGTMIVVENALKFVGRVVPVTVTRMHQTVAGKMVFGQVHAQAAPAPKMVQKPDPGQTHAEVPKVSSNSNQRSGRRSQAAEHTEQSSQHHGGNTSKQTLHRRLSGRLRRSV